MYKNLNEKVADRVSKQNEKVLNKLYFDGIYANLKAKIDDDDYQTTDEDILYLRELQNETLALQKKKAGSPYYFITVSPKPGVDFSVFKKKVEKFVSRKIVSRSIYCYELTKKQEPHVHLLVQNNSVPDFDFRRNTKNTFSKLIGCSQGINIKGIKEDHVKQKVRYILGDKKDEEKMYMVACDKEWRVSMNLEDFYQTGDKSFLE